MVFGRSAGHPLSWALKEGFQHVFCAVLNNGLWIVVDGRAGVPDVKFVTNDDGFDLADFYRSEEYTVVETEQRESPVWAPLFHRNCVGLVKAVLCIDSWALTPYGLYRYLLKERQHVFAPGV